MRDREALDGVGEETSENRLCVGRLREEDIDRPHWIAATAAELDEEHLPADEPVRFPPFLGDVLAASPLRPDVRLLLEPAIDLNICWVVASEDSFECHSQLITGEHRVVFRDAD